MDESDVLEMLNENLWDCVIVYLNARLLQWAKVFHNFNMLFLSEVIFLLEHKTYAIDDFVFYEGIPG